MSPLPGVTLTWLGQAGFLLRSAGATVLVDACLSAHDGRRYPPPVDPAALFEVDVVLCTHEHLDHFDAATVAAVARASPGARIVVPAPIVQQVRAEAEVADARVIGAVPGEVVPDLPVTIHPTPARHGVNVRDAYTFGLEAGETRYLGYVVELGGAHLYHAGDTIHWDGQEDALRRLGVHVALMPINGRDHTRESRNLVGNLDHREAALIAHDAGAELIVPMHWDLFDGNLGFPDQLVRVVQELDLDLNVLVPRRLHPFRYVPPSAS